MRPKDNIVAELDAVKSRLIEQLEEANAHARGNGSTISEIVVFTIDAVEGGYSFPVSYIVEKVSPKSVLARRLIKKKNMFGTIHYVRGAELSKFGFNWLDAGSLLRLLYNS